MSELAHKAAVTESGCSAEGCSTAFVYDPVNDAEAIDEEMRKLKAGFWTLAEDKKSITSSFTCRHFKAAVAFINAAAEIAERADMNHHPDLHLTSYRDIEVKVYTHAAGGLTKFDFKLARELDGIEVDYSPAWLKKLRASIDTKQSV